MKININTENLIDFMAGYTCCGTRQFFYKKELQKSTEVLCTECESPIMFRGSNGLWYYAGNRVFE